MFQYTRTASTHSAGADIATHLDDILTNLKKGATLTESLGNETGVNLNYSWYVYSTRQYVQHSSSIGASLGPP